MKILCTGDVHIGRRSTRLPTGIDPRSHSCAAAWLRIVDVAVAEGVDLVAVSGDLVDQANRFFEAYGPVETGLRRLGAAGIETVLVAGNHDFDVLPGLVEAVGGEGVHLLGRGGAWERRSFERRGVRLHVDGWSFPSEHHSRNPLASYAPQLDRAPVLAMVHGDLEAPRSVYAPIGLADLRRFPDAFFLLGHVHCTRSWNESGGARALYPGSPQAMDPGEPGHHGAHLVTASREGFDSRFIPLSTIRYEPLDVAVDTLTRVEEIDGVVVSAIRSAMRALPEAPHLRQVAFRLRLTGRSVLHRQLADRLEERVGDLEAEEGRLAGSVERVVLDTRPSRELGSIAAAGGAPAILARLIGDLEGEGSAELDALLDEVRRGVREIERAPVYLPVVGSGDGSPDPEVGLREELGSAAMRLLDELLAQKEVSA